MRKVLSKRIMAMMLALVLCLSGSFVMPVNAEASTEVPAETSLEDGISLASEDITPPVVSNVQLVENGTELTKDANGNMYIHFTFDAYDADGSAISAEKSRVTIFPTDSLLALDTSITELKEVSDGSYEMTCLVDNVRDSAPSTGEMYIAVITISDENGNGYDILGNENGTQKYTFSIAEVYSEDLILDTVVLDKTAINLTDTVLTEEVLITATVKSVPETISSSDCLVAQFKNNDGSSVNFYLYYVGGTKFQTQYTLGYSLNSGTYTLSSIALQSTGEKLEIPTAVSLTVNKANTDKTAPVIEELYLTVNGEKLTAGAAINKTDTVKMHVKVSDASGDDKCYVYANMRTDLQDAAVDGQHVSMSYDATTGEYIGNVAVNNMYATEWYVLDVWVEDLYGNKNYVNMWNYQKYDIDGWLDQYFILRSEDGNVSIPTYDYTIAFSNSKQGWVEYDVSSGRITTLQEVMASINGMIPEPEVYEGRTFEGWFRNDEIVTATDKIHVSGDIEYLTFAPKYDKAPVYVDIGYYGGTDSAEWKRQTIEIDADYGDSVKEIFDSLDLSSIAHNAGMKFDSWELGGMFYDDFTNAVVTPYGYIGYMDARYKCTPVWVSFGYYSADMQYAWVNQTIYAEVGVDTYQDVLDKAMAETKMNHCKDLTLVSWACDLDSDTLNKTVESDEWMSITANAKYSDLIVSTQIQYLDENGEFAYLDENVAVPAGSTYQDVYNKIQSKLSVKHSANHKFVDWELINAEDDNYTDAVGSQYAYMTLRAEYETYPVTYKYSYLTKDYEMKTVSKESVVDAGTSLLDYFENLTLPTDALVEDKMQWTFVDGWNLDEVDIANMDAYGVMEYTNYIPTATSINTVDENHNLYDAVKIYYIKTDVDFDALSNFWLAQEKYGKDLLELVKADATIPHPSDFTLDEYIWNYTNFYRDTVDANGKYKNTANSYVYATYDKTVVTYEYPDGKVTKEVKAAGASITLPATYNNQTVVWFADGPNAYQCDLVGGDVVKAESPYVELSAYYLGGSAVAPSTPVTPSPAPVTPSPAPVIPAEPEASEETKADTKTETETTTEETEEVEEVVAVKLDETVVEEKVEVVKEAEEGTAVVVEMKKEDGEVATEVPVEILEAAQGKNVDVVLDMGGYTWTINGQDIPSAAELKAINLEVTLDTKVVPPAAISAVAGEQPTRQISLTHNGDFGFKASLSINVGSENSGQYGNLYYYDSNNKLVFMNAGLIDDDGNVQLSFSHASDYIVVVDKDRTEDEAQKEEGGVIEDVTTPDLDEDSQTSDVDTNSNTDSGSSVSTFILVVAIILVVVGAAILVAFVVMKKKEE